MNLNSSIDMREIAQSVNHIRSAWKERDFETVARQSRQLLEREPENVYGLIYLARAAAFVEHWPDVASAGMALVRRSPLEAFKAARSLNRAGQPAEAARIYAELELRDDWFDAKAAELAAREAHSLLKAGQAADRNGDTASARLFWVAGARIAPHNALLQGRVRALTEDAIKAARARDPEKDAPGYIEAWREVLRVDPSHVTAATKIAWASERLGQREAVDAWLTVLSIDPSSERASQRFQQLVKRFDLEDHALRGLLEQGREDADPLVLELAASRDAKARDAHERLLKARLRQAAGRARASATEREQDPRRFLEAWKEVLVLDPMNASAAKKVVSAARQIGDYSELLEGLIALLEIYPGDADLGDRIASAGRRAGQEQRALECLCRHGLGDLSVERVEGLRRRVLRECVSALRAGDFDHALSAFRTLELVDRDHPDLEPLRPTLAHKAALSAKRAEKEGNLAVAVPLADRVLQVAPDQPVALLIVARDLWRHRRVQELIDLCSVRMGPAAEYEPVRRLLDRAVAVA